MENNCNYYFDKVQRINKQIIQAKKEFKESEKNNDINVNNNEKKNQCDIRNLHPIQIISSKMNTHFIL